MTPEAQREYRDTTWLHPKVEVRDSTIEGRGLFALENIEPNTAVIIIGGKLLTDEDLRAVMATGDKYSSIAIDEGRHLLLDTPNPAEYGNHSCDANTWMCDEVTTCTKRNIAAGEEVTIDYATQTGIAEWSMPCNCGALCCRNLITGNDWRLPDVRERYAGHFSPFLNARIQSERESRS